MKREYFVLILGIWVILLPQLGFPPSLKSWMALFTGLLFIAVAYSLRNERLKNEKEESLEKNFVQNNNIV